MTDTRFYGELASWWPLISPCSEYEGEATYLRTLFPATSDPKMSMLELGSGGGSNAFYFKRDFAMTLVDLSPQMLAVSTNLNPECEHLPGDMRTLRLGRMFDTVFVHDGIDYMTTEPTSELRCKPHSNTAESVAPPSSCRTQRRRFTRPTAT